MLDCHVVTCREYVTIGMARMCKHQHSKIHVYIFLGLHGCIDGAETLLSLQSVPIFLGWLLPSAV
jgi:hypothetical protein